MLSKRLHLNRADLRELLDISIPMVVSQGSFVVMMFFDRLFMSMIEPVYMAATMGGGVAAFFTIALFQGLIAYANAIVAQYYGTGDIYKCPRVVTQGVLMAVICLPFIVVIAYFVDDLFSIMGHEQQLVELEQAYYRVLMLGVLFNLTRSCIACYFSGIGRTRVIMIADVLGMLLNIPLSYALIFGVWGLPELGITGAAWGTNVATVFSLVIFLSFYFSHAHRQQFRVGESFVLDTGIMRRYARLGLPSGLEMFMNIAAFNLFLLLYQSFGVAYGAAASIVFGWDMVAFIPMIGLNIGVMSLIGRYVGAKDLSRANGVMMAGFAIALSYAAFMGFNFIFWRTEMINVFSGTGENFEPILEVGRFMMIGLSCYVFADALTMISGAVLRGAGDTRWLMYTGISLRWLTLGIQVLLIVGLDASPRDSWLVFVASILILGVVYVWRLKSGVWRRPENLARVMRE